MTNDVKAALAAIVTASLAGFSAVAPHSPVAGGFAVLGLLVCIRLLLKAQSQGEFNK